MVGLFMRLDGSRIPLEQMRMIGILAHQIGIELDFFFEFALCIQNLSQLLGFVARLIGRQLGLQIGSGFFPAAGQFRISCAQVVQRLISERNGTGFQLIFVDLTVAVDCRCVLRINRFDDIPEQFDGFAVILLLSQIQIGPCQLVLRVLIILGTGILIQNGLICSLRSPGIFLFTTQRTCVII